MNICLVKYKGPNLILSCLVKDAFDRNDAILKVSKHINNSPLLKGGTFTVSDIDFHDNNVIVIERRNEQ